MRFINLESLSNIIETENIDLIESFITVSDVCYNFSNSTGVSVDELYDLSKLYKEVFDELGYHKKTDTY